MSLACEDDFPLADTVLCAFIMCMCLVLMCAGFETNQQSFAYFLVQPTPFQDKTKKKTLIWTSSAMATVESLNL